MKKIFLPFTPFSKWGETFVSLIKSITNIITGMVKIIAKYICIYSNYSETNHVFAFFNDRNELDISPKPTTNPIFRTQLI